MIAVVLGAVLGLAVLSLIWLRVAARHAERRSVRDYERALGALGGVSRRSDRRALIPRPGSVEAGRAHVSAANGSDFAPARRPGTGPAPRARIELPARSGGSRRPDGPRRRDEADSPDDPNPTELSPQVDARPVADLRDRADLDAQTGKRPAVELTPPVGLRPRAELRPSGERRRPADAGLPGEPAEPAPARPIAGFPRAPLDRYAPPRRVYGPPLPGETEAPGGAVASELPNASPGDAPPEAPTEAVQTIGRQLPAAALDQLVARSRQSNVDAPASPAERSPSGEEVAPGGEARSRPGVAALTNGSTLRTSLPATGRGLRQRKGSGATGAGTGTGTGNGTGTAGAAAGSPSQLALPDAGDEGDATRLFAPVTQPARQTFGGVRPSGYDGGRENRGDVTSGGAEPPARGDLSLQPSLLDDQDAGSRDEIAVEAEVAGVEREPAGVVSPGETVALAGSSAGAVEEQHGVDAVPIVFDFDELAEPPIAATAIRPIRGLRPPSSGRRALRVATGAAAVVALAAAGVGIWEVATKTSPDHSAAPPTKSSSKPVTSVPASRPHHVSSPGATSRKPTTKPTVPAPTTTVASSNFTPVSTTPSLAVYRVPAGSYTFKFTVSSGDCWLGAEAGSGYAWMATVYPGTPSTYSTTGTSTIRIGAPSVLSVSVNGKPVVLPKNSQPYDIEFVPSSASSASSAR